MKAKSYNDALAVIKKLEALADGDDPVAAMMFLGSDEIKSLPPSIVGPGGPLHSRLLSSMTKIKAKLFG